MKAQVIEFGTMWNMDADKVLKTVTVVEGSKVRTYLIDSDLPLRIKNAIKRYNDGKK